MDKKLRLRKIDRDTRLVSFLYETVAGRLLLRPLLTKPVSYLSGRLLDSHLSTCLIGPFVRHNHIDLSDYEYEQYGSFNDFFTRKIKKGLRSFDQNQEHLPSPCDGLLSLYRIREGLVVPVKKTRFSIADLLENESLAEEYKDGYCMVFRLCVHHYHRYAYPDGGRKGKNINIPGLFHTVRPAALYKEPVFVQNCRAYTVLDTENFGKVVQMEVGAMLVGKIDNYEEEAVFLRGQEKGRFLYGGSTIILLIKKDEVLFPEWFFETEKDCFEIEVKMGECLGISPGHK